MYSECSIYSALNDPNYWNVRLGSLIYRRPYLGLKHRPKRLSQMEFRKLLSLFAKPASPPQFLNVLCRIPPDSLYVALSDLSSGSKALQTASVFDTFSQLLIGKVSKLKTSTFTPRGNVDKLSQVLLRNFHLISETDYFGDLLHPIIFLPLNLCAVSKWAFMIN